MIDDIERQLGAVERTVASIEHQGGPAYAMTLSRTYPTTVDDLWDAVTSQERLPRWFAPVEGDFKLGGSFQVKGNASGEILECEPPSKLSLTWEFGGDTSWVNVGLSPEGSEVARLTLVHISRPSPHWDKHGPGAVGVGWELGLYGLDLYCNDPDSKPDDAAFFADPTVKTYMRQIAGLWGDASLAAGFDAEWSRKAAATTAAFYSGEAEPG